MRDPKATYLYAGVEYPPERHDTMPDAAKEALGMRESRPTPAAVTATDPLAELLGDAKQATALREAGYGDVAAIRGASDADLLKVAGIGPATLEKLKIAVAG